MPRGGGSVADTSYSTCFDHLQALMLVPAWPQQRIAQNVPERIALERAGQQRGRIIALPVLHGLHRDCRRAEGVISSLNRLGRNLRPPQHLALLVRTPYCGSTPQMAQAVGVLLRRRHEGESIQPNGACAHGHCPWHPRAALSEHNHYLERGTTGCRLSRVFRNAGTLSIDIRS